MIDDREICRRIPEGDPDAFNAVYRKYASRLCAFVKQMTQDLSAAQDIVQETFTQLWRNPAGFRPECGSIRSYLFGIARKKTSEWWRTHKPAEPLGDDEVHIGNLELGSLLEEAMTKLTEEQRLLLWLREIEGQSYAELAAILEIPVGTVRSRLFSAREALRQVWLGAPNRKEGAHEVRSRRRVCLGPL